MRRLFGSLGSGGHKDASATMKETARHQAEWDEPQSSGSHQKDPHYTEEGELAITPEEGGALLAHVRLPATAETVEHGGPVNGPEQKMPSAQQ